MKRQWLLILIQNSGNGEREVRPLYICGYREEKFGGGKTEDAIDQE